MTDRHRTIIVQLDRDTRDDDLEHYLTVLRSIKGVASVQAGPVVDHQQQEARWVAGLDIGKALIDLGFAMRSGKEFAILVDGKPTRGTP